MNTDDDKSSLDEECGVHEEDFPSMGKCFCECSAVFAVSCEKICPHCKISSSLPNGSGLKMATIFECGRFGYGKRVTR